MAQRGSDTLRKIVHMAMGFFALLLRYLNIWQAALCALIALVHNLWVLPKLWGRKIYRSEEIETGVPIGIIVYPLSVLLLILIFGRHMYIVAAAWAIMAFGDGLAGLIGPIVGRVRIPWHPKKTVEGSLSFIAGGFVGSSSLILWTTYGQVPTMLHYLSESVFFWWIPLWVSVIMAVIETLPLQLNDNLSIPLTAGGLFYMAYHIDWTHLHTAVSPRWLGIALMINLAIALVSYFLKLVSVSGFWTGLIFGTVILGFGGWPAYALLLGFYILGNIATKLGTAEKARKGMAEPPRGWGSAVSKAGIPALLTLWWALAQPELQPIIAACITAAFAAALMDTVGTEIGKWLGQRAYLWWRLTAVDPGTIGAISVPGTVAGLAAGLALAAVGVWLWHLPVSWWGQIVLAVVVANLAESYLGHLLRPRGWASHAEMNMILVFVAIVLTYLSI